MIRVGTGIKSGTIQHTDRPSEVDEAQMMQVRALYYKNIAIV